MRWTLPLLTICLLLIGTLLASCIRQDTEKPPIPTTTAPADNMVVPLSKDRTSEIAIEHRDTWVNENPVDAQQIDQAIVIEIKKTSTGWHVILEEIQYPDQPEGESHHFLHIYLDKQGSLEKIVRGPDEIA